MFGQSTPFGSPPGGGFGQQNSAPGGFGTPAPGGFGVAPAPSGFGAFGASAPVSAFGGGSGFGAPAPSSGFGGGTTFGSSAPAPTFGAPASGGFGAPSSTLFGAPSPSPGGSLFGSQAPAPSGFGGSSIFGSAPAPAPGGFGGAFGSNPTSAPGGFGSSTAGGFASSTGGFGSTANTTPAFGSSATSTFGAPASSGGFFGSSAPATSTGFGASGFGSTPSAFGAPAASSVGFGTPVGGMTGAAGPGGTRAVPYQPTQRQDGTSHITLHSITAMPQYESKSFEELRNEDYSQGNKGTGGATQPGAPGAFGGFGTPSPAPSGGLFGSAAPAPGAFGAAAQAPGSFGGFGSNPAPAATFGMGSPAPGAFGATAPGGFGSTTSAFGAKPPGGPGLFGSTPTSAPVGNVFGNPAPAPPTGLFGSATPGAFGAPIAAPTGGLFGAPMPAPAPSTAFGLSSFGSTPSSLFGAPSPAPGAFAAPAPVGFGGFGSTPAPGGFGAFGNAQSPAPAFGAPTSGGFGGFGSAPSAFGAKPAGATGLFSQPGTSGGGLFGTQPVAPPAFGIQPQTFAMPTPPPVGSVIPPAATDILASQLASLENRQKEMEKKDSFRTMPSPSAAVTAASLSERGRGVLGPITPSRLQFSIHRSSPSSSARIRPRGFASSPSDKTSSISPRSLSKLGSVGKPMSAPESVAATGSTRLIVAPTPKPKLKLVLGNDEEYKDSVMDFSDSNLSELKRTSSGGVDGVTSYARTRTPFTTPEPVSTPDQSQTRAVRMMNGTSSTSSIGTIGKAELFYRQVIAPSPDAAAGTGSYRGSPAAPPEGSSSMLPKLTKAGYTCHPSIATLAEMDPADLAAVENFSVERSGVGKVEWEGAVDVRGADLDMIVLIENKSCSVYTEEEKLGTKPPVGTKLNRPAVLTLEGVFPPNGSDEETIEKFKKRVRRQTLKNNAELIDYDPETGVWKFMVRHFSRYAFDDSEDESDDDELELRSHKVTASHTPMKRKVDFDMGDCAKRPPALNSGPWKKIRDETPFKARPSRGKDDFELVSENENSNEADIMKQAEKAFTLLTANMARENTILEQMKRLEQEQILFPEEGVHEDSDMNSSTRIRTSAFIPSHEDMKRAGAMSSFIDEILIKSKQNCTKSNFDYGLRMGKSFRVGWSPDGSFLSLAKEGGIIKLKPDFSVESDSAQASMMAAHRSCCRPIDAASEPRLLSLSPVTGQEGMRKILKAYNESINDTSSVAGASFSLLEVVQETHDAKLSCCNQDPDVDARCMFAFTRFLTLSCSAEVRADLKSKRQPIDLETLLEAISTGDLVLAAGIADELGFIQLSILLASSNDTRKFIKKEMLSWKEVPETLRRCYRIIAGDLSKESKIVLGNNGFEWKRRMAMKLAYTIDKSPDLYAFMQEYEQSVAAGDSPFPFPKHAVEKTPEIVKSVLFKLLKLPGLNDKAKMSLAEYINPLGYSPTPQDFSLAYHLSSCISNMEDQPRLTEEEERCLADGYIAQLLSLGLWHWSVYFSLCSIRVGSFGRFQISFQLQKAKSLIVQNYLKDHDFERQFLESIGVPREWFEEALAYRCMNEGKIFAYVRHLAGGGKKQDAAKAFERNFLPSSLFVGRTRLDQYLELSDAFASIDGSLATVLPDLVDVAKAIKSLEGKPLEEIALVTPSLLKVLKSTEVTLLTYKTEERNRVGDGYLDLTPEMDKIPMGAFLSTALADALLMKLQILSLQSSGATGSITNTSAELSKLVSSGAISAAGSSLRSYLL